MPLKLRKAAPERLRSLGLDEGWLQTQIQDDPSLLGLGELSVVKREKIQPSGGRIDFVMSDPESETRYEVEIMLGDVDESHIIRTIEYWDMERQRYPTIDHRAVIVAERITSRFFNVIRLLNRAIPIIAIQLSAFRFNDEVILQFTRVLDTYEFGAEPEDDVEQVDKAYWERKARPDFLTIVESATRLVSAANGEPKITYNRGHIALGTSGYNFCWFYPRQIARHCRISIKVEPDRREDFINKLVQSGFEAENQGRSSIRFNLTTSQIAEHQELLRSVLQAAEEWSHR